MENNEVVNSCLMLAANLQSPVSFSAVFDSGDLTGSGVIFDHHVTVAFAKDMILSTTEVESFLRNSSVTMGPRASEGNNTTWHVLDYLKTMKEFDYEETAVPVNSIFYLDNFKNGDSGYVVLKLKEVDWYDMLHNLNKGFVERFNITSDFPDYTPHMTLAEVRPEAVGKYMNSKVLERVLENSVVSFEDFILSVGTGSNYKVSDITGHYSVDRFFRIRELEEEARELEKED